MKPLIQDPFRVKTAPPSFQVASGRATKAVDVYSFGVVMAEVVLGVKTMVRVCVSVFFLLGRVVALLIKESDACHQNSPMFQH